ncbi:MAG: terminase small subunit, partial [Firmicutes bacterium]|nr:terminase small subunit [Bacillota bacterium]
LSDGFVSGKIADAKEMQERLTAIIRGETLEEVIVVVGVGDGVSKAVIKTKKPSLKDIINAIDRLARMQGAYDNTYDLNVYLPVFGGEADLEE